MRIIKWSSGKCSTVCFACIFRCLFLVKIHLPLRRAFALAKQSSSFVTHSLQINIVAFVKYGLLEEKHGFEANAILFQFTLQLYSWEVMFNREVVRAPVLCSQGNLWCVISLTYWISMSLDFPISNHKW